ncbi:AraC family transcriptional regulator [Yimella sp. NH-Cas1]|nr:AraC family transcriptional regulator [Yimella sp. NH-Cas1]
MTIAAIGRRVGYASPYSLSAAFKKEYGVSPQHYRESRD